MIFPRPTPPAAPLYETWYEMKVRSIRERNEAVQRCINWGLSQGGAAKFLGIPKATLQSHMHNHGIKWSDRRAAQGPQVGGPQQGERQVSDTDRIRELEEELAVERERNETTGEAKK